MAYSQTQMTDNGLSGEALKYFNEITTNRGGNRVLRASRSKNISGEAQFVWRHVAFSMSRNPQHHCMPVCDIFYLNIRDFDERRRVEKHLLEIADQIINAQPKENWHGITRWAKAFGMI